MDRAGTKKDAPRPGRNKNMAARKLQVGHHNRPKGPDIAGGWSLDQGFDVPTDGYMTEGVAMRRPRLYLIHQSGLLA